MGQPMIPVPMNARGRLISKVSLWQIEASARRSVHISRAFTCHQMLALVRKIPEFAQSRNARLVLLPGFLETFYEEAIPAREARGVWEVTLAYLKRLAGRGFLLLATCPDHAMEKRRPLRPSLAGAAERAVACREGEQGQLRLSLGKLPGVCRSFDLTSSGSLATVWGIRREQPMGMAVGSFKQFVAKTL